MHCALIHALVRQAFDAGAPSQLTKHKTYLMARCQKLFKLGKPASNNECNVQLRFPEEHQSLHLLSQGGDSYGSRVYMSRLNPKVSVERAVFLLCLYMLLGFAPTEGKLLLPSSPSISIYGCDGSNNAKMEELKSLGLPNLPSQT